MKKFLLTLFCLLAAVTACWAEETVVDFVNSSSIFGTSKNTSSNPKTYSNVEFEWGNAYYYSDKKCILFGKKDAYISFIAPQKTEKILVKSSSGCSINVELSLFADDELLLSKQKFAKAGDQNTWEIPSNYQAKGTKFKILITNDYNCQISEITFKSEDTSTPDPVDPNPGPGEDEWPKTLTFTGIDTDDSEVELPTASGDVDLSELTPSITGATLNGEAATEDDGNYIFEEGALLLDTYGTYVFNLSYADADGEVKYHGTLTVNYTRKQLNFAITTGEDELQNVNLDSDITINYSIADLPANETKNLDITLKAKLDGVDVDDNVFYYLVDKDEKSITATVSNYGTYTVTATAHVNDDYEDATCTFTITTVADPDAKPDIVDVITATNWVGYTDSFNTSDKYFEKEWKLDNGAEYKGIATFYSNKTHRIGLNNSTYSVNGYTDKQHAGIFVTKGHEGYALKSVEFVWDENYDKTYTMQVYYSDKYFSSPNDFNFTGCTLKYDEAVKGSNDKSTFVNIVNGTYEEYIGIRSKTNAQYISEIRVTWEAMPEATIAWAEDQTTEETFVIAKDNDDKVKAHEVYLNLNKESKKDFAWDNVTVTAEGADVSTADELVVLSFAEPGEATVTVAPKAGLKGWYLHLPKALTVKVNPIDPKFTTFAEDYFTAEHQSKEYDNIKGHFAEYEFTAEGDNDRFIADDHKNFYKISLEPNFNTDGFAAECADNEDHAGHHGNIFDTKLENTDVQEKSLKLTTSMAGSYTVKFDALEDYKKYIVPEALSHSFIVNITPAIEEPEIAFYSFGEDGTWIPTMVYDKTKNSWILAESFEDGDGKVLVGNPEKTFVNTGYNGTLYYKVNYKKPSTEESTPDELNSINNKLYAPAAQAVESDAVAEIVNDGYTPMTGRGFDISNAESINLAQVVNGVVTKLPEISVGGSGVITGVEAVEAVGDTEAEYFTIEGLKVAVPLQPGVYVKRSGAASSLIMVK